MVDSEAKFDLVDFVGVGRCSKGFEIDINDCQSERQVICWNHEALFGIGVWTWMRAGTIYRGAVRGRMGLCSAYYGSLSVIKVNWSRITSRSIEHHTKSSTLQGESSGGFGKTLPRGACLH
jgi:hypothetical protein